VIFQNEHTHTDRYSALQKFLDKTGNIFLQLLNICWSKITFANNMDQYQAPRNVGPDLLSISFDTQHKTVLATGWIAWDEFEFWDFDILQIVPELLEGTVRGVIRKFAEKYCNFIIILYFSLKNRVNIDLITVYYTAKFQMRALTMLKVIITVVTPTSQHRSSIYWRQCQRTST